MYNIMCMVRLDFNTIFTFYIPGDSVVLKTVADMPVLNPPVVCCWVVEESVVVPCVGVTGVV